LGKQEAWERKSSGPSPSAYPLVNLACQGMKMVIAQDDKMEREYRRAVVVLTAEDLRRRTGRSIASADELAAELGGSRTAFDPLTNKPFVLEARGGEGGGARGNRGDEQGVKVIAPSDALEAGSAKPRR
jgi:hypothetical protein